MPKRLEDGTFVLVDINSTRHTGGGVGVITDYEDKFYTVRLLVPNTLKAKPGTYVVDPWEERDLACMRRELTPLTREEAHARQKAEHKAVTEREAAMIRNTTEFSAALFRMLAGKNPEHVQLGR